MIDFGKSFLKEMQDVIEKYDAKLRFENNCMRFIVRRGNESLEGFAYLGNCSIDAKSFGNSIENYLKIERISLGIDVKKNLT